MRTLKALAILALLLIGCSDETSSSSDVTPSGSTPTTWFVEITDEDVTLDDCHDDPSSGLSAEGTVTNSTDTTAHFAIDVAFANEDDVVIATASGYVDAVPGGRTALWKASSFNMTELEGLTCEVSSARRVGLLNGG